MQPNPLPSTPSIQSKEYCDADIGRVLEGRDPGELKDILTGFLGSVPGAVLVLDKEWRLVYLNEEAEKFFSDEPSSLLCRPLEEVYPRQYGHMLAPKTIQGIIKGSSNSITRYAASFDRWYKLLAYSSDSHVFVRLEDVTLDVISQRMMRLNQFSIEHSPDMVFWIKPNGHIIKGNRAAYKSLGFKQHELAGMMIMDIDQGFTRNRWAEFLENMKCTESMTFESSFRTVKRTGIPVEVTCSYFVYHGEEYVVASARDITERKRSEEELRESRSRMEAVFKSMTEGVVIGDAAGNIIAFNDAALRIHGFKDEKDWRRHLSEFAGTLELYGPDGHPLPLEGWPLSRVLCGGDLHPLRSDREEKRH